MIQPDNLVYNCSEKTSVNMVSQKEETFDIGPILDFIGPKGKWQYFHSICMFLIAASAGLNVVSFAFPGFVPNYRCPIPICETSDLSEYYSNQSAINKIIHPRTCHVVAPIEGTGTCDEYLTLMENITFKTGTESCQKKDLIYDRSVVTSSLIEDFGMTCHDAYQRDLLNSIFMIGTIIGGFTMGIISDNIGRIKAVTIGLLLMSVPGIVSTLWINQVVYGVYRVLAGMGFTGAYATAMVISSETAPPKQKIIFMFIPGVAFHVGEVINATESYFFRDWKTLQRVMYVPILILVLLYFVLPEPARWLMSKGKIIEAKKVLQKRALMNGKGSIPEEMFAPHSTSANQVSHCSISFIESLKTIVKTPKLLARSINVMYLWFCAFAGYHGTIYMSTRLSGNPHLNFALSMIPGIPGTFLFLYLPDRLGRRNTLILSETIVGVCILIAALIKDNENLLVWQVALSMIIRFIAGVAIKVMYTLTAELYPTMIRSTTAGIGLMMGGFGGFFGLAVQSLTKFWSPLPFLIIGSACILASILGYFVPETNGEPMPQTIEDALNIGKNKNRVRPVEIEIKEQI